MIKNLSLQQQANELAQKYLIDFNILTGTESEFIYDYAPFQGIFCADMYLNFLDVKYCVDNSIPFEFLYKWYWKSLKKYEKKGKGFRSLEQYILIKNKSK